MAPPAQFGGKCAAIPAPAFLLAPGAGAPASHPRTWAFARLLEPIGRVELFDYVYALEGRRRPDPLPKLIEAHRAALRSKYGGPIVLAGKSMGARVGCHVVLIDKVQALISFGYPLCGGGDRSKLRDQVLLDIETPILFVQGTRDPLCPLDLLDDVRKCMRAPSALHVVDGGDYSLLIAKATLKARGSTQEEADDGVRSAIVDFLQDALAGGGERRPLHRPSGGSLPPRFAREDRPQPPVDAVADPCVQKDQGTADLRRGRNPTKPSPAKPASSIAQADASGTAETRVMAGNAVAMAVMPPGTTMSASNPLKPWDCRSRGPAAVMGRRAIRGLRPRFQSASSPARPALAERER